VTGNKSTPGFEPADIRSEGQAGGWWRGVSLVAQLAKSSKAFLACLGTAWPLASTQRGMGMGKHGAKNEKEEEKMRKRGGRGVLKCSRETK
jgi:hypothetical protein